MLLLPSKVADARQHLAVDTGHRTQAQDTE